MILLTDGGSNIDDDRTIPNADSLKNYKDTIIDVVAIGDNVSIL